MSHRQSSSPPSGHGEMLKITPDIHFNRLWDPTNNKGYLWKDVEVMISVLGQFFEYGEQKRAAEQAYMVAVKQPGASPMAAFQQAVMASAFAQKMDALYANDGGLIIHLEKTWPLVFNDRCGFISAAVVADMRNAKSSRRLHEIKKLMAADREGNAGGLTMEALQAKAAVAKGPEADAETDSAASLSGSMVVEVGDEVGQEVKQEVKQEAKQEVKQEVKEKVKVDAVAKSVTEMRLGELWVIVQPKDAEPEGPQSG